IEPHEYTRSNAPRTGRSGRAAHTHGTRTPRSSASRAAFRSPSRERSTPTTSCPCSARKTLSRPSPQPRSSARARGPVSSIASRARAEGRVPQMKRSGVFTYSRPHGLQGGGSRVARRPAPPSVLVLGLLELILAKRFQERAEFVGVILFPRQDLFQHPARRRIVVAEKSHHL